MDSTIEKFMNNETLTVLQEDRVRSLFDGYISKIRLTDDILSKYYVFDNQIETAKDIIYDFYLKSDRWCLLFAEMQSGKSGTFFSIPYIISRNQLLIDKLGIDMYNDHINVFLLTGMNEKELISQFEKDISNFTGMEIEKNVLHNSEMQKFLNRPEKDWLPSDKLVIERMRKNSLILIDESHYGSDKNQILDKFLKNIVCLNPNGDNEPLIKNNIYVVSISATPMAEFLNANISEFKKKIVPLKNSKGYFGIVDMFENDQVFHSYDLKSNLSVDRFLDTILSIKKNGYILVRCTKKQQIAIESRIVQRNITKLSLIDYFRNSKNMILDNQGINDIIEQLPNNKTLIFLRGLLRAGKRLNTENIVMVHDTSESKVDTAVQSLLGRCCGYNKNKDILIYCDKISAEKYKNWVITGYDMDAIPDKSKNILGNSSTSIRSFRNPIEFDVSDNKFIIDSMSNRAKRGMALQRNVDILKSLNSKEINDILSKGVIGVDYTIGTIFSVDIDRHKSWLNGGKMYTSYQKQYLDVINNNIFMGDYKEKESEVGKIVFSAAYEVKQKKLLVSFGLVVKNSVSSSEKSMYHSTNSAVLNKRCQYRNCNKPFIGRGNQNYCSKSCRSQESVYVSREKIKSKL